ncbi:unnamed protein product [Phytophthora fragariaefolia]|uniref:Unnamed protein product n=1 Tax=Phytophthora fragariaefolia TaxID=1490495 RepID=A0A9W6XLZ3_9STRA|nr:unnamed protein product [Phytophthora fragariaefolia]
MMEVQLAKRHKEFFDSDKHRIILPGMKDDYEYDAEGDVNTVMPQPIFEVTRALSLKVCVVLGHARFLHKLAWRTKNRYDVVSSPVISGQPAGAKSDGSCSDNSLALPGGTQRRAFTTKIQHHIWSQSAITTFLRERKQYEGKVIKQCRVTGEVQAAVTRSIRSTLEPRVLEHVAHYILIQDAVSVSNDMLVAEMKKKVDPMVNGRVPNVKQLFERELKMDLSEVDVEARIAAYFMEFVQLVEEHGLASMLGRDVAIDQQGHQRMKLRCKLLLSSVTPEMLKADLTRLVELIHREATVNGLTLHDLMIESATRQQQYHLMKAEMKNAAGPRSKETPAAIVKTSQRPTKQQQ